MSQAGLFARDGIVEETEGDPDSRQLSPEELPVDFRATPPYREFHPTGELDFLIGIPFSM